jgi:hypothetical protein
MKIFWHFIIALEKNPKVLPKLPKIVASADFWKILMLTT